MSFPDRFAILLDGAFVLKKLSASLKKFPSAENVVAVCDRIIADPSLSNSELLRIYYYDAKPSTNSLVNPIDGSLLDLSNTSIHTRHTSLLNKLELKPDFALRLGETATHGWEIGVMAMKDMLNKSRAVKARDLVPNVTQKGVDLRIGLDIARMALTKSVGAVVAVTGDSDLIPAFKFARREGVRVYLDPMKHGVRRELKAHCDRILDVAIVPGP